MSLAQRMGLPESFQTTLLMLAVVLTLAPYLAGMTIGNLQIPKLPLGRRRLMRIAGPLGAIAALAMVLPLAALVPATAKIELLAADVTPAGEIDVAIANSGSASALVTKIELEVLRDRGLRVRPALVSAATYRIAIDTLAVGGRRTAVVRHLIPPATTERLTIAPETTRSLDVRLRIYAAGGAVLTKDVRLWAPSHD